MSLLNWIIVISVGLLSLTLVSAKAKRDGECDSDWLFDDRSSKCFFFFDNIWLSFYTATAFCERLGGTLAMPTTWQERHFIGAQLSLIEGDSIANEINEINTRYMVWLGGQQFPFGSEDIQWLDGSNSTRVLYDRRFCTEECCAISMDGHGTLSNSVCLQTFLTVCQKYVNQGNSSPFSLSSKIAHTLLTLLFLVV